MAEALGLGGDSTKAMDDDLNTTTPLAAVFDLAMEINTLSPA